MALFSAKDWAFAEEAAGLVTANPFEPEWMDRLHKLLSRAKPPAQPAIAWQPGCGPWGPTGHPRTRDFGQRIESLTESTRAALMGGTYSPRELAMYERLALYSLYRRVGKELDFFIDRQVRGDQAAGPARPLNDIWDDFLVEHNRLLVVPGRALPLRLPPNHVFAYSFLFRRAFYHIFFNIVGSSRPAARLRSEVWRSAHRR
jgi:hypothetical protein